MIKCKKELLFMMDSIQRTIREIICLYSKAEKLYDGQVDIFFHDGCKNEMEKMFAEEKLNEASQIFYQYDISDITFYMNITPNDGLYKNATCKFLVNIDKDMYPRVPPIVHCLTRIYHPNIDHVDSYHRGESNVCINLLSNEHWEPQVGLDGAVMAVLYLFHHPEFFDAFSRVCSGFKEFEDFEEKLYKSLRGKTIDGYLFDKLIDVGGGDRCENLLKTKLTTTETSHFLKSVKKEDEKSLDLDNFKEQLKSSSSCLENVIQEEINQSDLYVRSGVQKIPKRQETIGFYEKELTVWLQSEAKKRFLRQREDMIQGQNFDASPKYQHKA